MCTMQYFQRIIEEARIATAMCNLEAEILEQRYNMQHQYRSNVVYLEDYLR